jgi:hypothetical protein
MIDIGVYIHFVCPEIFTNVVFHTKTRLINDNPLKKLSNIAFERIKQLMSHWPNAYGTSKSLHSTRPSCIVVIHCRQPGYMNEHSDGRRFNDSDTTRKQNEMPGDVLLLVWLLVINKAIGP